MKQPGFFNVEEQLARLSGLGDQLEAFSLTVDFEVFRPELDKVLAYADGRKGGRPPFGEASPLRNHRTPRNYFRDDPMGLNLKPRRFYTLDLVFNALSDC